MNFVDFFAGIGGIRLGLEQAGHKCVGFCEFDKYARTAYKAMYDTEGEWENHDVRTVKPYDVPAADLWCFGFPCFMANTLVQTSEGLKAIQDVKMGDYVITHKNRMRKVIQTMNREVDTVCAIHAYGVDVIPTTPNHPFWVRAKYFEYRSRKRKRVFSEPHWVKAKDLTKDHYLSIPVNLNSIDIDWQGIKYTRKGKEYHLNNLPFDNINFYWLIGRFIGDGWVTSTIRNDCKSPREKVTLCCSKQEFWEVVNRVKGLLPYTVIEDKIVYKFIFSNKELHHLLKRYGEGASNKFVHKEILDLPVDKLEAFLDGYLSADGCVVNGRYKCSTVSRKLAYGIAACVNKVYKRPCAIYKCKTADKTMIDGREVNQKDFYQLVFSKESHKQDEAFYEYGFIYVPIRDVKMVPYKTTVYNIGVEEDESYTANSVSCHNCQDISVAGKQKGLQEGERSGLFYEIMRLLAGRRQEDRPQWLLVENVKNLLSIGNGFDFARLLCEVGGYGYSLQWDTLNSKDYGVPQNRERVFVVGYLGNIRGREVFPLQRTDGENPCKLKEITQGVADAQRIYDGGGLARTLKGESGGQGGKTGLYAVKCVGNTNPCGHGQGGNVYSTQGLAPALTVAKSTPLQVCMSIKGQKLQKQIDVSQTLYSSCRNNLLQKQTCCAVLTPDREEKRQNGRRMKEPGEPSFTLTAQDRHGVAIFDDQGRKNKQLKPMDICPTLRAQSHGNEPKVIGGVGLPIREATKQGYSFAYPGDGVNIGMPNSATRRGRVNHGLANTLTTASEMGVVDDAIRIRRLTPRECWRLQGFPDEYFDKAKAAGISDTQLYKQAGNGVTVNVSRAIGERLKEVEEHGC